MKMRNFVAMAAVAAVFTGTMAWAGTASAKSFNVSSPDGKINVTVNADTQVTWSLAHDRTQLLTESPISMTLTDGTAYGKGSRLVKAVKGSNDTLEDALFYKKDKVEDKYNSLTLKYKEFDLIFRVYDDGAAYRFISKSKKPFEVKSEEATFSFPEDWKAYIPYVRDFSNDFESQFWNSFENTYIHQEISKWDSRRLAFLPLVVEAPDGKKICITEADLINYPGMYLYNGNGSKSLKGVFAGYPDEVKQGGHNMLEGVVMSRKDYIAKYDSGTSFPWRAVIVSTEDKELTDSDMVWRLATPADPEADFSWVKPGKVAWEWWNDWNLRGVDFKTGVNNETYRHYIDFAAEHGIEYVILDEGWAVNRKADLMQVVPEIDLKGLADYAAGKNVGLILWAGYLAFDRDMEEVCRHYSEMGIKGFKIDFMDRDDQPMVDFHRRAAETAARYGLMVDFHGTYKPTGLHRTYPNVINYEGVHGLEQMKWAGPEVDQVTYDVTIPFIRMVAGPFDYTQGAMRNASRNNYRPVNSEPMSQGTRCRQLAEYVVFESPLNMLCDSPSNYRDEPECTDFISGIPTVWDETVALDGKIAEYVAMARRSGSGWYVGAMTDWTERDMTIDLSFLGEGDFVMEIFTDGVNADKAASDWRKEVRPVPASRKITVHLAPGGGFAAKIAPASH